MSEIYSLENHILIATPSLNDANFRNAVVLICEHDESGAMGIIINKPLEITLGSVLDHLDIDYDSHYIDQFPVLMGGPIGQENGFIVHCEDEDDDSSMVNISSSKDMLKAIAKGRGPGDFIIALGYAGWQPGQLEEEIASNDWLITSHNTDILFRTPTEQRRESAAKLLGIDINQLSDQVGHA